jgi:hypothetical protein
MGVMLSLDRHRPAKGRRRAQHARYPDGRARGRALATLRRYDAPVSVRLLSRLTRTVLPWRNGPAGRARSAPARDAPGDREWSLCGGMSVACLLGECRDEAGRPVCDIGTCEHDCHRDDTAPGARPGAGRAPAA